MNFFQSAYDGENKRSIPFLSKGTFFFLVRTVIFLI